MEKIKTLWWNIYHELLNFFRKRDNSIVLMGAWFGNRFADNSRFLYQYLAENKSELGLTHVIWVTRSEAIQQELCSMGYESYLMDSEESIYFHKKAGIHIICNSGNVHDEKKADILAQYSNGAFKINLWHGLGGIKGVGLVDKGYLEEKKRHYIRYSIKEWLRKSKFIRKYFLIKGGWGDSYYLSTTPFSTKIFMKYFALPYDNFIESGYPRNQENQNLLSFEFEVVNRVKNSERVILYMPTFRDDYYDYESPLDNSELISMLKKNGWLWIEKKHAIDTREKQDYINSNEVLQLEAFFDASIILPYVDLVITDYSSVSWDALYYRKPVVFYMPDYNYYKEEDRGFVLKPEEFIIGPDVYTVEQLYLVLKKYEKDFSMMIANNEDELFEKFWGRKTDCSMIWNDILRRLESKK